MKKIVYLILIGIALIFLLGCQTPGTTSNPDQGNNKKYNFEKYYYNKDNYVIIVTRKDSLEVINTSIKKDKKIASVIIDENERPIKYINDTIYQYRKEDILLKNDSIIIIKK